MLECSISRYVIFAGSFCETADRTVEQDVGQYVNTGLSITDTPRMPWHDVRRINMINNIFSPVL